MNWKYRVKITQLFTEEEEHASVQASMTAIYDVLSKKRYFDKFFNSLQKFRSIPEGDDTFGPVDYANKLLAKMYDFADARAIWIE